MLCAVLLSMGHIILVFYGDSKLYLCIACIGCGYGFCKSNVSCLLGHKYNSDE
ncbi:POT-type proton-dependent oligopeptide transporter [Francisella tularensis]